MVTPMEFEYEVFLSFRGPDTRHNLADYLYDSLMKAQIQAYKDNEELRIGKEIGPELLQVIKQSKILMPILSKEYAASPWCLMELVQMVECKENCGQKIMPVFYDVEPSEVRHQIGSYEKAINSHIHKGRYTDEAIQNWKAALKKIGELQGWELKDRCLVEFTEDIVRTLLIELKKNYVAVSDYLVEMDDHVDKIMEEIGEQTTETKIVGIYGMGGVGKTTLATIIYNKLSANSTDCCFLSICKDTKIETLQNEVIFNILRRTRQPIQSSAERITEIKRLSSRKVVLLLDDVVQKTQLDALMGKGKCWFCGGSKVIITTRNREVLTDVDLKYELTQMDPKRSLQLFSKHAFRRDHPPAEYVLLSEKAVKICGGLPLSLEVIGSLLAGKDRKFWMDTLERLKNIPDEDVKSKLNISVEALEHPEKEIFLDVCCFFVGFDVRIVTYMWASRKFFPIYSLEVLQWMSLIKIAEGNRLWVHDQLRDLGQNIIRERANFKPEKQSRVWDHEEATDVLKRKEGTENVEAICLKFDHQSQFFFKKEEFASLSNLRFLQVDCGDLDRNDVQHLSVTNLRNLLLCLELIWLLWHNCFQHFSSTNWFQRNLLILQELRFLSWHKFPIFFQLTAFSFMKLVILDLSWSEITNDWEGWNHLKVAKDLKVLNLTRCRNLHKTPDFSAHENLERLILKDCNELVEVDKSIGKLKRLVFLNLEGCRKLRTLPDEMEELEALTELSVGWTSITEIPQWRGMKKLETLHAYGCRSLSICNLAGCLSSLSNLTLGDTNITKLPSGNFCSLVELNLSASNIEELPNSIGEMENLRVLRMSETRIRKLPSALGKLQKLEEIYADDCRYLEGEIPIEIGRLSSLRILSVMSTRISKVPELPESLTNLSLETTAPDLQSIARLRKLKSLTLSCRETATLLPSDFNLLSSLRSLQLHVDYLECPLRLPENLSDLHFTGDYIMEKSIDLSHLEKLSELHVYHFKQLEEIQGLERLKNLTSLYLHSLLSLVKLPDLTNLTKLRTLWILSCPRLVEVRGQLESLETLYIASCESFKMWPDSLSFKNLRSLMIHDCRKLEAIQGLEDLEHLRVLDLRNLPLLEKLPDLTKSKMLRGLVLVGCSGLDEIRGELESLECLYIGRCSSLRKLSDPSSLKELKELVMYKCEKFEETLESEEYRDLKKVTRIRDSFWWSCYIEERKTHPIFSPY